MLSGIDKTGTMYVNTLPFDVYLYYACTFISATTLERVADLKKIGSISDVALFLRCSMALDVDKNNGPTLKIGTLNIVAYFLSGKYIF